MTIPIPKCIVWFMIISVVLSCGGIDSKIKILRTLGQDDFSRETWVSGDPAARGRMIYRYLIERSPLSNLRVDQIRKELGENTAYYLYDHFPAYYIGPQPPGSQAPGYLMAFIVDHASGMVTDIHIEPMPVQ